MFLAYLALASIVYVVGSFHAQRTSPLINTAHVMGSRHYALRMTSPFVSASSSPLEVDVAVLGGGIAGSTISYLLAEQQGLQTALIDPAGDSIGTWYPNYGEWRKEWHCLSERLNLPELKECTTNEWEYTDVFFGGSHGVPMDSRKTLDVPYVRVDRIKLQSLLRNRFKSSGKGMIIKSKVNTKTTSKNLFHNHNIIHHNEGSTITLENGDVVNAKLILDSTGLESQLIQREKPRFARGVDKELNTGYQIAYGVSYHVTSTGPYNSNAMTLFDYRTDHFASPESLAEGKRKPTFMYVMPLEKYQDGTYKVFFEETSLVGRGERRLTFKECRQRTLDRLAFHNIEILGVEEEEYCYIPMGGELPCSEQRIIAFGGAANMVHPSTGYHACRMMAAATDIANVIGSGLKAESPQKQKHVNRIASECYKAMWSRKNRLQRDFQAYGGDFLMEQPVDILRGFFTAFFKMDTDAWGGFLAGWPGLPGNEYHDKWDARVGFALKLFLEMPNDVRVAMMLYAIKYTLEYGPGTLLRSLTPDFLFGSGPMDELWSDTESGEVGDISAKNEAREYIRSFEKTGKYKSSIADAAIEPVRDGCPAPFEEIRS